MSDDFTFPERPSPDAAPWVGFFAKSTEDKHGSIPTQRDDFRAMVEREGGFIVAERQDEGFSAYSGNRGPGFEDAKRIAAAAAEHYGVPVNLGAQHSDRLARGAGDAPGAADHLGEVYFWARRHNVRLRSAQDDSNLEDALRAVLIGERNTEDSRRKSEATKAGKRRASERGDWIGGILPDGYRVIHSYEDGRTRGRVEFDPDRKAIYDLIWEATLQGFSANAITAELGQRGYLTNPRKRGQRPRPFDANRVRQTRNNPFYAGLSVAKGEVVGEGKWPRYVEPEDFYRLRAERQQRSHGGKRRGPGRPPEGYLLARIAVCGECGSPMDTVPGARRKDGTRPRRYVCRTHRERSTACDAKPIDAALTDPAVIDNLPAILGDFDAIRDGVAAGRAADRTRLEGEAHSAREEAEQAAKGADRMAIRIAALYAAGEDAKAVALEDALARCRAQGEAAQTRLEAALDAISALSAEDDEAEDADFWQRLRAELATRVDGANGDVKRLNLALADFLEAVELTTEGDVIRLVPRLSGEAVSRILRDTGRWPHGVSAEVAGMPAEVAGDRLRPAAPLTPDQAEAFEQAVAEGDLRIHVAYPPAFEATDSNPHTPS